VHNSLACWIIFYLEISMWVHYQAYVRGLYRDSQSVGNSELNRHIFIRRDNQYINLKNELTAFWESLPQGKDKDQLHKFIFDLLEEISRRIRKLQTATADVSHLHGGLSEQAVRKNDMDNRLLEVLIKNQEAAKFMGDLCMVPIERIEDHGLYL
jgi:hypothetical protein